MDCFPKSNLIFLCLSVGRQLSPQEGSKAFREPLVGPRPMHKEHEAAFWAFLQLCPADAQMGPKQQLWEISSH